MRKILLLIFAFVLAWGEQIYANFDVLAQRSSKLMFLSSGVLNDLKVDVSSEVKKGEILASLESNDEQIALKKAKVELEKAKVASEFASATFAKFKQVKGVTSAQSYDEAKFNYENALVELKKAQIGVENAKNLLEKKQLYAPFDGVISAKFSEIGSGVIALNSPIFEIISTPDVKILIHIDEAYANIVKVGDKFHFNVAGEQKSAKISLIYPTIDTHIRKFSAQAITSGVKIGSFGEGYVVTKNEKISTDKKINNSKNITNQNNILLDKINDEESYNFANKNANEGKISNLKNTNDDKTLTTQIQKSNQ